MLIYGSTLTAASGKSGELSSHVPAIRDAISDATGQPWWAWAVVTGRPFGTHVLSSRFEGMADLVEAQQKVGASADFQNLSTGLTGVLAGPAETNTNEVVHATGEPGDPKPLITITQATMSGGQIGATMAWSTNVMDYATELTGAGGIVATSTAGTMFQVTWMAGVDSAAQLDEVNATLNTDAGYLELMDAGGGMFIPGSAERVVIAMHP